MDTPPPLAIAVLTPGVHMGFVGFNLISHKVSVGRKPFVLSCAEIHQLALVGWRNSLHAEACNALGASNGIIHRRISHEVVSLTATGNNCRARHELLSTLAPTRVRGQRRCPRVQRLERGRAFAAFLRKGQCHYH
jgi:hypothetical protein